MLLLNRFSLIKWHCYLTHTSDEALQCFSRKKFTSCVKGQGRCKSQETKRSSILPEEKMINRIKFSKIRKVLSSHRVWKATFFFFQSIQERSFYLTLSGLVNSLQLSVTLQVRLHFSSWKLSRWVCFPSFCPYPSVKSRNLTFQKHQKGKLV